MTRWLLLGGAIASEVTGSLSLKAALDQPAWYVLVALGYIASFAFLAGVLRTGMPIGVAYGVWGALGVAATAGLAAVIYGEALTVVMLIGITLIVAGVLTVELGSQQAAQHPDPDRGPEQKPAQQPVPAGTEQKGNV